MKRLDLLRELSFGVQIAEEEVNELAGYFVETNQWAKIARGDIDIVRGEKGAGKSAIYSLLMQKAGEFFDKGILLVPAENPRGATVFKDLASDPPTSETEFVALWKLYILTIVAQQMREYDFRGSKVERVYGLLEEAGLLEKQFTLRSVLRTAHALARRLVAADSIEGGVTIDPATQLPSGVTGKIVLSEPSADLRSKGYITLDNILELLNEILEDSKIAIWVLLDRLDVAFIENHSLEANALRALIRAYADIRNRDNNPLKIFLREDIWKRITESGMREASHLVRFVVLDWTAPALLNLIIRRILSNQILIDEFDIDKTGVLQNASEQEGLFYRFFPQQVEQGPQKASTFKWLVTRCADGTKKTAPRELIQLLNCILDREIKRLEQGGTVPNTDQLFDRSVFKTALPEVSNTRLTQYLYAEYPSERPFVSKLEGQKAEQTPETLAELWSVNREDAISKANRLVELGFFEERGTSEQPTYWVPFLYRDSLKLVQGRAESEE